MDGVNESFSGQSRRVAADNLKRCPLCGALNSDTNLECFVCSWSGVFDHDEDSVVEALGLLIERCPELAAEFTPPPERLGPFQLIRRRVVRWVAAKVGRCHRTGIGR